MSELHLNKRQMKNAIAELRRACFERRGRRPRSMMYPQYITFSDDDDSATHENFQTAPHILPPHENVVAFNDPQEILDTIAYWQSELH